MGISEGVKFILQNADAIGAWVILLLCAFGFVFGIVTSRIYLSPEVKRILKRCEALEATVPKLTGELTDSRVLYAESRVRIEVMESQLRDKDNEIDSLSRRLSSVEAELTRIRETWIPPSRTGNQS